MIDLSTDEGIRAAMFEVTSWPATEPVTDGSVTHVSDGSGTDGSVTHVSDGSGSDGSRIGGSGIDRPAEVLPIDAASRRAPSRPRLLWAAALLVVVGSVAAVAVLRSGDGPLVTAARGTWESMAPFPLEPRLDPSTLWTGTEMIVWGGHDRFGEVFVDGAAYDPRTDTWRTIADYPFDHWRREGTSVGGSGFASSAPVLGAHLDGAVYYIVRSPDDLWAWDLVRYDIADDTWAVLDENRYEQLPTDEIVPIAGLATVHGPDSLTAWNGQLVVTGWRSDLGSLGWSMLDVPAGGEPQWSGFLAVEGSSDLYGFGPISGSPTVIDDRHLVFVTGSQVYLYDLGYSIDLVDQTAVLVEYPSEEPFGESASIGYAAADAGGLVTGVAAEGGRLQRFAARVQPETGEWVMLEAPHRGQVGDVDGPALVATPYGSLILGGIDAPGRSGGLEEEVVRLAADPEVTRWVDIPRAPIDLERTRHTLIWTGREVIVWGGRAVDPAGSANVGVLPLVDGARYRIDPPETP
ncbi:MAG: hypothetical protein ACE367_03055 [Acidimicrobiales bacterium]